MRCSIRIQDVIRLRATQKRLITEFPPLIDITQNITTTHHTRIGTKVLQRTHFLSGTVVKVPEVVAADNEESVLAGSDKHLILCQECFQVFA